MELNNISFPDFVKLANVIWNKGYNSVPQVMRGSGIVREYPIPANSGNTREFSSIDGEEYAKRKNPGDQAARARVQQGYTKVMTKYRVALDIGIQYEMMHEGKYPEIVTRLTNSSGQVARRMDLDLTHRLTFCNATTYTDMDGVLVDISVGDTLALASTAHTLRGSATTFRNILANNPKVAKGSLESMERLVTEETVNQFGEKVVLPFNIIFSGDDANTVNTIKEYLQSSADITGSNSGVTNVYASKYKHVILPRLATTATGAVDATKRYMWGLVSSEYSTMYLGVWEEPRMKVSAAGNNSEEFSTDDQNFGTRGGYGIATVDSAWIKVSLGDGTV